MHEKKMHKVMRTRTVFGLVNIVIEKEMHICIFFKSKCVASVINITVLAFNSVSEEFTYVLSN